MVDLPKVVHFATHPYRCAPYSVADNPDLLDQGSINTSVNVAHGPVLEYY